MASVDPRSFVEAPFMAHEFFSLASSAASRCTYYRMSEAQVLGTLLPMARLSPESRQRTFLKSKQWVEQIRRLQAGKGGVDALLNEFSLSTEEGIVLMCLAEALLRVPDNITTDRLIRDKILQGNWASHPGHSESLFVNASAWGLLLTGKLISLGNHRQKTGILKKTVSRLGEPVIRSAIRLAMQIMGTQFVMGKSIAAAIKRAVKQESKGYRYSYDMLGEGARTQAAADRYFERYREAIESIGLSANGKNAVASAGISVKLSALHPRYEMSQWQQVLDELVPRLKQLALMAKQFDIGFTVDAEEADRLELSLAVIEAVFKDDELSGWHGFGLAIQAYQKRALCIVDWAIGLAQQYEHKIMVRLVKGAYWDSEIKWCQQQGLTDYPVFTRKASTDVSYHACAKRLLETREYVYPQFATHNAHTVATILSMDDGKAYASRQGYEFQRLHGMGETLYDQILADDKVACRIYAPVGEHEDLLAYLVRRLLENGANSSFVNNIIDESVPVESLLQDPAEVVASWIQKSNPNIVPPNELYASSMLEQGSRINSQGWDLSDPNCLEALTAKMDNAWNSFRSRQQAVDIAIGDTIVNPAHRTQVLGRLAYASASDMLEALTKASTSFESWSKISVNDRASLLRTLADQLETHTPLLLALCVKEAGKTLADAVAEIREAVDFCRYYADRGEALFQSNEGLIGEQLQALGVVLCISPWNFPVAIFLGQITAALVCGNTVLAKPAEQTSLVAMAVVELMHATGFPKSVIQCLPARGKSVGDVLVSDSRVKAVMFTGSTATAQWIHRALAERDEAATVLVAETGGQNAMIVDSTALPEQVIDDVIQSGFQSAGQRCSALRVLFLQEDVADNIIDMIKGAMDELHIGDPALISTDVGPVIDETAQSRLLEHVSYLSEQSESCKLLHACDLPNKGPSLEDGFFFAPRLYELSNLALLKAEVFGPVVHVIRYTAEEMDQVVEQINASGFGLTLGVHSRIQTVTQRISEIAKVGNVYINRNMIGAVVGVQPFGGRDLSGTGPKAGGPNYLTRLVNGKILSSTFDEAEFSLSSNRENDILLPGPTGESNRLCYEPKGVMMLVEPLPRHERQSQVIDRTRSLRKVVLAAALGNRVLWHTDFVVKETLDLLNATLKQYDVPEGFVEVLSLDNWTDSVKLPSLAGVLIEADDPLIKPIERALAVREGSLLSVITESNQRLLEPRLMWEKTITEDTTATGGNTSLMTLES